MRNILFICLISVFLFSCSKNELVIESIALAKTEIEGGIPFEFRFKDLSDVNLDYDNFPTDNYFIEYTFTNIHNETIKGETYLGGQQKNNSLLVNISLLTSKSHTDRENSFFRSNIFYDSLKSIKIRIYEANSPDEILSNKLFTQKDFKIIDESIDFDSY